MTNEELDALVTLIAGSKIDMLQRAVRALTALRAERDELRAAIFGSADYSEMLRNGNFVEMARGMEAGRKGAIARAEAAEARVAELEQALIGMAQSLELSNATYHRERERANEAEARALAAEAAALERAAAAQVDSNVAALNFSALLHTLRDTPLPPEIVESLSQWMGAISNAIRALITPEGRTALEAALADARRVGMARMLRDVVATLRPVTVDGQPHLGSLSDKDLRALAARVEGDDA